MRLGILSKVAERDEEGVVDGHGNGDSSIVDHLQKSGRSAPEVYVRLPRRSRRRKGDSDLCRNELGKVGRDPSIPRFCSGSCGAFPGRGGVAGRFDGLS